MSSEARYRYRLFQISAGSEFTIEPHVEVVKMWQPRGTLLVFVMVRWQLGEGS